MLDRYELFVYKQWLRVYMRSKVIKHNKDLLECIDDTDACSRSCRSTDCSHERNLLRIREPANMIRAGRMVFRRRGQGSTR